MSPVGGWWGTKKKKGNGDNRREMKGKGVEKTSEIGWAWGGMERRESSSQEKADIRG